MMRAFNVTGIIESKVCWMRFRIIALLAVLLAAGCVEQPTEATACPRPYLQVGGDCCLDENGDRICDRDKPVCVKPYLQFTDTCCLDADANLICDRDEVTGEHATTTLPATTTTAAPQPEERPPDYYPPTTTLAYRGCLVYSDCKPYEVPGCDGEGRLISDTYGPMGCVGGRCVYRVTKDIGAWHCQDWEVCVPGDGCVRKEATTTTLRTTTTVTYVYGGFDAITSRLGERYREEQGSLATTTTTTLPCIDPDGGRKYNTRAVNVTGYFGYNKTNVIGASEYCMDDGELLEFYCQSGVLESVTRECVGRCLEGRCCARDGGVCESDRDCCAGSCRPLGLEYHCVG